MRRAYQIDKIDGMIKQVETILKPVKSFSEEMLVNILPPVTKTIIANPLLSYLNMGEAITEKIVSIVINKVMKYYKSRPLVFLSLLDKRLNTIMNSRSHIQRIFWKRFNKERYRDISTTECIHQGLFV